MTSGAVAWRARPGNRTGVLMIAYGTAVLTSFGLLRTGVAELQTLGVLILDGSMALFVLVLLAFPDGRIAPGLDRLVLWALLVVVGPLEVAWLLFLAETDFANALLAWPSTPTADGIDTAQRVIITACQLVLAFVLARRWRRASPPLRRTLAPALVGAATLLVLTVNLLADRYLDAPAPLVSWAGLVAFIAVPVAMLASLLQARLARAAVGGLMLDLHRHAAPNEMRRALARALGDPSLQVAYWLEGLAIYADEDGAPFDLPAEGSGRAVTPLARGGQPVAALIHDPFLRAEPHRLAEVAAAAAIAIENTRLQTELLARVEELRGSRMRIVNAADAARRRIERDLHDGAQQRLVTLSLSLGMLESRLDSDPELRSLLQGARQEAAGSLRELRDLARGIHPAVLAGHGLEPALQSLVATAPLPISLAVDLPARVDESTEVAAYYLVAEALTNMAKYARASEGSVVVRRVGGRLVVEVADDGVGGADAAGGTGLRGLADRVEALDGSLRVSSPVGAGTRVQAEFPCG